MATAASIHSFLRQERIPYTTFRHPVAYSAQGEAAAAHVPGDDWAKTVVCFAGDEPLLAVLPAPSEVDLEALALLVGAPRVRLADETEVARLYPGVDVGAMSPLGPLYGHRVFVDVQLAADRDIVFTAGTHADAIRMHARDFREITHATTGAFARRPAGARRKNEE